MTEGRLPEQRIPTPAGKQGEPQFPPGKRRAGRPKLLNAAVEEKYFAARRAGNTQADSARFAGLVPVTVEKWLRRGRGVEPGLPAKPEYVRFYRMDEEAKATVKVLVVGNIVARSRTDIAAALAWLKVHGGEEWRGGGADEIPGLSSGQQQQPALGPGPTIVDQSSNQYLLLPREAVSDVVHQMLEARRRERDVAEPINVTPEPEQQRFRGNSRAASNGLRVDAED